MTYACGPEPVPGGRLLARGKFLSSGGSELLVRGVTYGTFRPAASGDEYPPRPTVCRDFAAMALNGINAVRTYTMPPRWLLDTAEEHGLRVLPSLAAERVIGYLNDGRRAETAVARRLVSQVHDCSAHPAVLGYSLGNEIPASTVRWLGPTRVERFLRRMYNSVKDVDPAALVTYVNYPSTEYLDLRFLDLACFNVFLEHRDRLSAYLARLQNLAGERPLLMTELGLDSVRNGERTQAQAVAWQLRTAFEAGCAGAFVYAWTDEWHRGGEDVHDWAFGLTDVSRRAKPALRLVRETYADVPFRRVQQWPRVSVVVCAYNAAPTIQECLDHTCRLDYPDYEVIVVDDGSTDATAELARNYPVRLISTPNRGLSSARNTGLEAVTGTVVAYVDSDAYPDSRWLQYLANTFMATDFAAVGGPNLPPPGDGTIAECVARSPGGPTHVLLSDAVAEHIPGCNMAFRVRALRDVGAFDPRFRSAGDDVDVCWKLQSRGWTVGFSPAAVVWHHRRNSLRAYWRQQCGYGRAEALLEQKWPEKYNTAGHLNWAGRIYQRGGAYHLARTRRIYHGTWGTAPFQSLYAPASGTLTSLALTPEWLLLSAALISLAALGVSWVPLVMGVPIAALAAIALLTAVLQAAVSAARTSFPEAHRVGWRLVGRRSLITLLHLVHLHARLWGRLMGGLTLWRGHGARGFHVPVRRTGWTWNERAVGVEARLRSVEAELATSGHRVWRGGDFDRWDLAVRCGPVGSARLLLSVEEMGGGAQLIRYRCRPVTSRVAIVSVLAFGALAGVAGVSEAYLVAAVTATVAAALATTSVIECGAALGAMLCGVRAGLGSADDARRPASQYSRSDRRLPTSSGSQPRDDAASPTAWSHEAPRRKLSP